jgi:hypothetical protein
LGEKLRLDRAFAESRILNPEIRWASKNSCTSTLDELKYLASPVRSDVPQVARATQSGFEWPLSLALTLAIVAAVAGVIVALLVGGDPAQVFSRSHS